FHCTGPDAASVVTCTGGSFSGQSLALPSGAPTVRHIRIRVFAPDIPGTYTNNAFVDPSNAIPEGHDFNTQASIAVPVANAGVGPYIDLAIDKTQDVVLDQDTPGGAGTPVRVDTGQGISYMLHVTNGGEGDAFNVTVRDIIPAGTTFFSAADTT